MKAKISFSSVDATSNPLEWMYRLEDAGFQGWEIVGEGMQKVEGEFKARVKEIYETTNLVLSLHAPLSDINIASVNERIWEESIRQIKECIENTYEFIADICVVHPGVFSPLSIQMPEMAIQKAIEGLTTLSEFAAERGLRIAVENLPSSNMLMGRYPDELIQIVRGVNMDNLGLCLDVAHANTTKTLDEFLTIKAKAEDMEIIHLHTSDNFGADDLHLPLGKGNQDWKKVLNGINDCEYEGLMVMELYTIEGGIESLEFIRKRCL
ncbi:MAG: sugar phosphate isomerase/epimerase family protein [Halobacteriota archaeon]